MFPDAPRSVTRTLSTELVHNKVVITETNNLIANFQL